MRPLIVTISLCLALWLPGCCTDPVNGESWFCLSSVSDQEEAQIGAQYAPTFIAESGGIYPDPELHAYLNDIVINKMALNSHRPDLPWEFHVLNTSQINAFALPGGQVFVTRGLLARLENEAQFAHLMGHEIGHVSHRHGIRGQSRSLLFQILLGVVAVAEDQALDPETPHLVTPAVAGLGQLALLKYSREQELQSDRRGVDYAIAAGYDPLEGKKTFEMFLEVKRASGQAPGLIEGLMSTHPLDEDRIDQIDEYVAEAHPDLPRGLVKNTPRFASHLAEVQDVQAVYADYDRAMALVNEAQEKVDLSLLDQAESLLRNGQSKLPSHAPFPAGLGVIALTRDDHSAAERWFNQAVNLQPDNFLGVLYRGVAREELGRLQAAETDFIRAHELHGSHPLPCYLLGKLADEKGQTEAAVSWYEKAVLRSPADSALHGKANERIQVLRGGSPA